MNEYEDDSIEYDYDSAMSYINEGKNQISSLNKHCEELVGLLSALQTVAHDIDGSTLKEDYKDFEVILGSDGLKKYVKEISECFEDIEDTINSWERITHS